MVHLPPLVEPAGELTPEEVARYSRHLIIPNVGTDGQKRLRNARVLVVGAGGLGSPALLYLAAAGVGTLGIVEFDDVELSNLQRQIIHGRSDVGRPKADSARDSILELNDGVEVALHRVRLDSSNALELFRQYDLVLDGTDNFATRYLVNDAAALVGIPYVWGSIYRFEGQVSVFWDAAPGDAGINYRDLYPEAPPPGMVPSCAEGGVLGVLCASIGSVMVTEAIKLITGIGETLLGRLMIYDALAMNYRTVGLTRDPHRTPITELIDYEAFCGVVPATESTGESITPGGAARTDAVRTRDRPHRRARAGGVGHRRIDGARSIPKDRILSGAVMAELPQHIPIVLYCKTGIRSAEVLSALVGAGFSDAAHLHGGIVEWAKQIDPGLPMY